MKPETLRLMREKVEARERALALARGEQPPPEKKDEIPRWRDGTPKKLVAAGDGRQKWVTDRLQLLRETLDVERVNSGDPYYFTAHEKEIDELLALEIAESKKAPPKVKLPEGAPEVVVEGLSTQAGYLKNRDAMERYAQLEHIAGKRADLDAREAALRDGEAE